MHRTLDNTMPALAKVIGYNGFGIGVHIDERVRRKGENSHRSPNVFLDLDRRLCDARKAVNGNKRGEMFLMGER